MRRSLLLPLLLLTLASAGCERREDVVAADYVFASVQPDGVYGQLFGHDTGLHAFVEGWETPRSNGVWARGDSSDVSLYLLGRKARLRVVMVTPTMLAQRDQEVAIAFEGAVIDTIPVTARPDTVEVAVPDDAWEPGPVRLTFVPSVLDTWTKSHRSFRLLELSVTTAMTADERKHWKELVEPPPADPAWATLPIPEDAQAGRPDGERPDVLLFLSDTARADHHSCYGYSRETSPTLDSLATAGVRLDNVISDASYTVCAVPSLLTGRSWREHRVENLKDALPQTFLTLAELLHDEGYATFGMSHNPNVSYGKNLDQGFDEFYEIWALPEEWKARKKRDYWPELTEQRFAARLEAGLPEQPVFFYVHTMFAHAPYFPLREHDLWRPEEDHGKIVGSLADLAAFDAGDLPAKGPAYERFVTLYDGAIRRGDASLRRMLDAWRSQRGDRPLLVVFVSDHGEGLGEHGRFDHGNTPYQEATHVPVVFSPASMVPGLAASASRLRALSDVMPILLHYLDVGLPPGTSWPRRFLEVLADPAKERQEIFVRCMKPLYGVRTPTSLAVFDGWRQEYYDLTVDPGQQQSLRLQQADAFLDLRLRLRAFLENDAGSQASEDAALSEEDIEQLKALGYL